MLETLASKQALADAVLELRGDIKEVRFKGGRQAFLSRLQQLLGSATSTAENQAQKKKVLPQDPALAFSYLAAEKLGEALVRCEERYPLDGFCSVLVAIVETDANSWREKLFALHKELCGNGQSDSPTKIEVIDRATDEAVKRLMEAGLLSQSVRGLRPLYSRDGETPAESPLSESETQKVLAYREKAGRKLKMALLLENGDLVEEAREACLETVVLLGRAIAVAKRVQEPAELDDALKAPLSIYWGEAWPVISKLAATPCSPIAPVAETLQKIADCICA
jgi:hypothetical protein